MHLYEVIWKDRFVDKIAEKHGVTTSEVEEVLFSEPHVRFAERGHVKGENLFVWPMDRQQQVGIYWSSSSASARVRPCRLQPGI